MGSHSTKIYNNNQCGESKSLKYLIFNALKYQKYLYLYLRLLYVICWPVVRSGNLSESVFDD